MTDTSTRSAGVQNNSVQPNVIEFTKSTGTEPGTPLVMSITSGEWAPARANSYNTARGIIVAMSAAAADEPGFGRYAGPVTLTTDEWDARTGDVGGLVKGDPYFVSTATAGKLTKTLPTGEGNQVAQVGVAISSTTLLVQPAPPYDAG